MGTMIHRRPRMVLIHRIGLFGFLSLLSSLADYQSTASAVLRISWAGNTIFPGSLPFLTDFDCTADAFSSYRCLCFSHTVGYTNYSALGASESGSIAEPKSGASFHNRSETLIALLSAIHHICRFGDDPVWLRNFLRLVSAMKSPQSKGFCSPS